MSSVKIFLKSGEVKDFPHEGRAGGSWTKAVRYEGAFVIVKDEWGNETAYPVNEVEHVETYPEQY